jgi:hypothetical protein
MALTIQEISKIQLVKNNPVPVKVNTDKRPKEKSKPIFDLMMERVLPSNMIPFPSP